MMKLEAVLQESEVIKLPVRFSPTEDSNVALGLFYLCDWIMWSNDRTLGNLAASPPYSLNLKLNQSRNIFGNPIIVWHLPSKTRGSWDISCRILRYRLSSALGLILNLCFYCEKTFANFCISSEKLQSLISLGSEICWIETELKHLKGQSMTKTNKHESLENWF